MFFAYSGEARSADIMRRFQRGADQIGAEARTWEDFPRDPNIIFCDVCSGIFSAELTACEVTDLNQNVLFEFGYALGRGRHTLLLRDESRTGKVLDLLQDIKELRYENLDDILRLLHKNDPFDAEPFGVRCMRMAAACDDPWRARPNDVHLLYIKSGSRSDGADAIEKSLKRMAKEKCFLQLDDPYEDVGHPLYSLWRRIAGAHIVVANLIPHDVRRRDEMNARACLLAGIALALEKHVVVLQATPADHLIDLRPIRKEYTNASHAQRIVESLKPLMDQMSDDLAQEGPPPSWTRRRRRLRRSPAARVTFGNAAAEFESEELRAYFVETPAYQEVLKGQRVLLSGRLGSGKTAICLAVQRTAADSANQLSALIWPEGLDLPSLASTVRSTFSPSLPLYAFQLAWRYVLYTEVAAAICDDYVRAPHTWATERVEPLKRFCDRAGIATEEQLSERLRLALEDAGLGLQPEAEWKPEGKLAQLFHAQKIAPLEQVLAPALETKQVFLLADNLDKYWRIEREDVTACNLVLGLVNEAQRIARTEFGASISPVIFLRDDVRRVLQDVDPDADKKDWLPIQWDAESLKYLIAERIRYSLSPGELGMLRSVDDLWSACFCATTRREPTAKYIVSRTLLLPRQLIWFCAAALDLARTRGHTTIEQSDVVDAERGYSDRALRSLTKEYESLDVDLSLLPLCFEGASGRMKESQVGIRLREWARMSGRWTPRGLVDAVQPLLYETGFLALHLADGGPLRSTEMPEFEGALRRARHSHGISDADASPGLLGRASRWLGLSPKPPEVTFSVHPAYHAALSISQ